MIDIKTMMNSIRGLHGELKSLERKIEALKQRREQIEGAPLPPDDFADMILETIDQAAQGYRAALGRDMAMFVGMPESQLAHHLQKILIATLGSGAGIGVAPNHGPPDGCLGLEALWCLFGGVIRPKLKDAITAMNGYPAEVGLPRRDRPAVIEKLDKEIDELESREAKLLAEAEAAGLRPVE